MLDWMYEFPSAITVCDDQGIIIYMNNKSILTFEKEGGDKLIGKSLIDCHPEPAKSKLLELLDNHKSNVYTIEKNNIKKLIYQSPWYEKGKYMGLVEQSFEIPFDLPHFKRG